MITQFKIFENNKPDLRKINGVVECIKDYGNNFKKGYYYEIKGYYGDPQRAIEEFGINDYLPAECIGRVVIPGDNKKNQEFSINLRYEKTADKPKFFEHFKLTDIKKYNI